MFLYTFTFNNNAINYNICPIYKIIIYIMFEYVSFPIFLISLAIGLFYVYVVVPTPHVIVVYPTPIIRTNSSSRILQTIVSNISPRK